MLKYYRVCFEAFVNGKKYHTYATSSIYEESDAVDTVFELTWENLEQFYKQFPAILCVNVRKTKKGRIVSPADTIFLRRKEWKHPSLGITLKMSYYPQPCSINDILEYRDGEQAMRYMKERDMILIGE